MVAEQLDPAAQHCWLADSSAQVVRFPRNRKEHLPLPRNGLFSALKLQAVGVKLTWKEWLEMGECPWFGPGPGDAELYYPNFVTFLYFYEILQMQFISHNTV